MSDCAFLPALGLQVCHVSRQLDDILDSSPRVASRESKPVSKIFLEGRDSILGSIESQKPTRFCAGHSESLRKNLFDPVHRFIDIRRELLDIRYFQRDSQKCASRVFEVDTVANAHFVAFGAKCFHARLLT